MLGGVRQRLFKRGHDAAAESDSNDDREDVGDFLGRMWKKGKLTGIELGQGARAEATSQKRVSASVCRFAKIKEDTRNAHRDVHRDDTIDRATQSPGSILYVIYTYIYVYIYIYVYLIHIIYIYIYIYIWIQASCIMHASHLIRSVVPPT
jgi:hypothetical protein